tara:strand:- start:7304 stop:7609 length:306 start_codon:yes stop_codon:yes gene_type:complete
MENKLQRKGNQYLEISDDVVAIARSLVHYNQLTPYILSDTQLQDWAKSILELAPDIKPNTLRMLIDKMKTGEYDFDNKLGIQNILKAYRAYKLKNIIPRIK